MVNFERFQKLALAFPGVTVEPHFEKISFRVKKKIFATYDKTNIRASVKLTEVEQSVYSVIDSTMIYPVNNKWGKQGWTVIEMTRVPSKLFAEILECAYKAVAGL